MPPGGAAVRAERLATLEALPHELFIDDAVGGLLEELRPLEESVAPRHHDAGLIRVTRRDWEKRRASRPSSRPRSRKRPPRRTRPGSRRARRRLRGVPAVARPDARAQAALRRVLPAAPRSRTTSCSTTTSPASPRRRCGRSSTGSRSDLHRWSRVAPDEPDPFMSGPFPEDAQHALSLERDRALRRTTTNFRLDPTVHPFCTSSRRRDVRLTTRYDEGDLTRSSRMHEIGHGLYERGVTPRLERTPLAHGLLVGAARVAEPAVGERRRALAAVLALVLPADPGGVPRGARDVAWNASTARSTASRRSYIRVDADEATYGIHIILRFELEQECCSAATRRRSTSRTPWNTTLRGVPRRSPSPRIASAPAGHPLVGRGLRLLPLVPARQRDLGADLGEAARGDLGDTTSSWSVASSTSSAAGCVSTSTGLGRKFTTAETLERVVGGADRPGALPRATSAKVRQHFTTRSALYERQARRWRTSRRRACRRRCDRARRPASTRCSRRAGSPRARAAGAARFARRTRAGPATISLKQDAVDDHR